MIRVSVVVPVKDEAGNAGALAREIHSVLSRSGREGEILFVDDGSKDGTVAELMAIRADVPELRILQHGGNFGQSRAVRTGVKAARGDVVVTLDGDGQNDPADIPKLLAAFEAAPPEVGMIAGQRTRREDNWKKRFASRHANRFRRWLLNDRARDTGCGLKAFRRASFLELPYFDHQHRYLISLMLREGYDVRFVDVGHRARGAGRSKYGVWDRLKVGVPDLLGVLWLNRRFKGPTGTREL
jgi:dolichol-phosphate mannosyltransferase